MAKLKAITAKLKAITAKLKAITAKLKAIAAKLKAITAKLKAITAKLKAKAKRPGATGEQIYKINLETGDNDPGFVAVSYTHLTLPTMAVV